MTTIKTIINEEFFKEIALFNRLLVPVSGGKDSTAIFIDFMNRGLDFELIWNNTGRSLVSARCTLAYYILNSGKQFYITVPMTDQKKITDKTKKAFKKMLYQMNLATDHPDYRKYDKHRLPCCRYVKHKPFEVWLKNNRSLDMIVISGIAGYEGWQRQAFLSGLRKRNTFLHYHKTKSVWFAYPFRDYTSKKKGELIENYINGLASRTGCFTCPIAALFDSSLIEEEQKRIDRSKKVWIE